MRGAEPLPQRHVPRRPGGRSRADELAAALAEQQSRVTEALESFADNTMRYLREEGRFLSEGIDFPPLRTRFRDRHALVVARGPGHKRDLRIVRPVHPGLQAGADRGRRRRGRAARGRATGPDVIVGDMDSVSDGALRCGRRASRSTPTRRAMRRAPSAPSGSASSTRSFPRPGISEDVALLLAYEKGAELIVAVGTHFNMIEFLERNRAGMSSTFLTRLRVGEMLVDAKGVSRLVSRQVGVWPLMAFIAAGLGAIVVAVARVAGPPRADRPAGNAAPRARRPALSRTLLGPVQPTSSPRRAYRENAYTSVPGPRRNRDNHRAVRIEAQTELLATRPEVWALLAEPQHLADWWPAYASIRPDRRGLARAPAGRSFAAARSACSAGPSLRAPSSSRASTPNGASRGTTSSSASPPSSSSSPPPTA